MDLIFDIDGTLWNTTDVVATAWNRAVRESGLSDLSSLTVTGDMLKKEFGKPMDVIADDLFGDIDKDVKADLLKRCCRYEHEAIEKCTDDLTYKGVRETMRLLSKKHRLFIVSNCQDGYIELVMAKNGITDIIEDYECFGRTGLQKDENIRLVIDRNGLKSPVYIGDTLGDMEATHKAGIPFVFARYGFGNVSDHEYVIDDFSELTHLF
ncbi:MAG: HAD family hydrolase [Lachnospiraceae bacterium]|nr:HAD family hydrolase [Lachnospiraceae bacterium]